MQDNATPDNVTWSTPAEVAFSWGVSTRTVLRLIQKGKLPAWRINARVYRISEIDASVYWATNQIGGASDTSFNGNNSTPIHDKRKCNS